MHDRGSGAGQQVDVGVAQPDAMGEALRSPSTPIQPAAQLAASGESISPGALQRALECVQVDAGPAAAAAEATAWQAVAGPLRRHDRELGAQQRIAGELAHECLDRLDVRLGGHARAREATAGSRRPAGRRGDERVVAVVGKARAVAPVRRERDALSRRAVGAERLLQLARVGVLGRAVAGTRGEMHVQVCRHAALDQQDVLAECPEVRIDGVQAEHRPHPRLEGRVAQAGLRRPRVGVAELHRRDPHAVVMGIDEPWQHQLAVASDHLRGGVRPGQGVALADLRDGAVTQQDAAARQRRAWADASRTSPQISKSAMPGTLSPGRR